MRLTLTRAVVAAIASLLVLASVATATNTSNAPRESTLLLVGGGTTVQLDKDAAKALASLKINVAPSGAARAGTSGITFPVTFGHVDVDTLEGQIRHSGGLLFTQGRPGSSSAATGSTSPRPRPPRTSPPARS